MRCFLTWLRPRELTNQLIIGHAYRCIYYFIWSVLIHQCHAINGGLAQLPWMNNYILLFCMDVITHPCPNCDDGCVSKKINLVCLMRLVHWYRVVLNKSSIFIQTITTLRNGYDVPHTLRPKQYGGHFANGFLNAFYWRICFADCFGFHCNVLYFD